MFDKSRIKQDFSKAAASYDAYAGLQQKILKNLLEKAEPLLPTHAEVLDVGCGTGQLATLLPGCKATAIDIAYSMCKSAAGKGSLAVNAAMEALPFISNRFDMVFSSLALQWVEDWRQALNEMERVLKPGGVLAVSSFGEGTLHELKQSFAACDNYPHVSEFTPSEAFDRSETVIEYFPDLSSLMHYLKNIGAHNKLEKRSKAVMTPRRLLAVGDHYTKYFASENGLPVTWEVLYSVKTKIR
jgi:malonyl-CoA O-methyltransferase